MESSVTVPAETFVAMTCAMRMALFEGEKESGGREAACTGEDVRESMVVKTPRESSGHLLNR